MVASPFAFITSIHPELFTILLSVCITLYIVVARGVLLWYLGLTTHFDTDSVAEIVIALVVKGKPLLDLLKFVDKEFEVLGKILVRILSDNVAKGSRASFL